MSTQADNRFYREKEANAFGPAPIGQQESAVPVKAIPANLGYCREAIDDARQAFHNLSLRLTPVLHDAPDVDVEASYLTDPQEACEFAERLRVICREINRLRSDINYVADRLEV